MENKYITTSLIAAVILLLMSTFTLGANVASLEHDITQYELDIKGYLDGIDRQDDKIKEQRNDIEALQYDLEHYECPECPECPEPETVYITEYVYDYIYLDNAHCDVTGDGRVDYNDVCDVLYYVNHGLSLIEEIFYEKYPSGWEILYDTNRDGCVDLADVELIMEYRDG